MGNPEDYMLSSVIAEVKIETEEYPSEEVNDLLKAVDRKQVFDLQTKFSNCITDWGSDKCNDSLDGSSVVKVEEEMLQINTVTPYTCEICNATYDGLASYEVHVESKHGSRMYNTAKCETPSDNLKTEEYSLETISAEDSGVNKRSSLAGEKPYKCNKSTPSFALKCNLNSHRSLHTGQKCYKACTSSFSRKCDLQKRTHIGERTYKCNVCTSNFSTISNLNRHRKMHPIENCNLKKCDVWSSSTKSCFEYRKNSVEKLYKCKGCPLSFNREIYLRIHQRTHVKEKLYKCNLCTLGFNTTSYLNRHKKIHALENQTSNFSNKSYLEMHTRGITYICASEMHKMTCTKEKKYKSALCTLPLAQNDKLMARTRKNPYMCDVCNLIFTDEGHLISHKKGHTGDRSSECDVYSLNFSL